GVTYFLFGHGFAAHELFKFFYILIAIKRQTMAFAAVPAGSACFLVIAFNTFRDVVVDHKTYIWLVNAHSKSNGGYNYIYVFHQEHILMLHARLSVKAGVIGHGLDSIYLQRLGEFLNPFSAQAINNAAFAFILFYETN